MKIRLTKEQRSPKFKNRNRLVSILKHAAESVGMPQSCGNGDELHFILVDSATMTEINETYLSHEGTTDVITFDFRDEDPIPGENRVLGEIYVCLEVAEETGKRLRTGINHELILYCIHGILHLNGFDDRNEGDRRKMRGAEQRILTELQEICVCDGIV